MCSRLPSFGGTHWCSALQLQPLVWEPVSRALFITSTDEQAPFRLTTKHQLRVQEAACRRASCQSWFVAGLYVPGGNDGFRVCVTVEKCNTPCTTEEFTCDNGCCLDPGLECDSTPQCSDGSDERKCDDCKLRVWFGLPAPVGG